MNIPPFDVAWRHRDQPRPAAGAVADGDVGKRLARRILESGEALISGWIGVSTPDTLVILGEEETLPWVDGVLYVSRDDRAPRLFLPTTKDPNIPVDVFERALLGNCPFPPPLVVFGTRVISISEARTVSRTALELWLSSK